jgi:hypothetical protein
VGKLLKPQPLCLLNIAHLRFEVLRLSTTARCSHARVVRFFPCGVGVEWIHKLAFEKGGERLSLALGLSLLDAETIRRRAFLSSAAMMARKAEIYHPETYVIDLAELVDHYRCRGSLEERLTHSCRSTGAKHVGIVILNRDEKRNALWPDVPSLCPVLAKSVVGVEKVTSISRMRFGRSMLEKSIRPCSVGFSSSEAC